MPLSASTDFLEKFPSRVRTTAVSRSRRLKLLYGWHWHMLRAMLLLLLLWLCFTWIKSRAEQWLTPALAHSTLPQKPLDPEKIPNSLHEVLSMHTIKGFRNFRYVMMDDRYYYQLKNTFNRLQYFNAVSGKELSGGDQQYAITLARYFSGDNTSPVQVTLLKKYNAQYDESQRLLPVYEVAFSRADGLKMYVETDQSRLSAYHTRSLRILRWPDQLIYSRAGLWMWTLPLTGLLLGLAGIIGYSTGCFRNLPAAGSYPGKAEGWMSAAVAGASVYLLLSMPADDAPVLYQDDENAILGISDLSVATTELPWKQTRAYNASVVSMPQGIYYQLFGFDAQGMPATYYYHAGTGELLRDGEFIYARYLANIFKDFKTKIDAGVSFSCCLPQDTIPDGTQIERAGIISTELITAFDEEYRAAYKRLPVVKVSYRKPEGASFYIETASSSLSALLMSDATEP